MFKKKHYDNLSYACNFAENRSNFMRSVGLSPSYTVFIHFLKGIIDKISESKFEQIINSRDYEIIPMVVKKDSKEYQELDKESDRLFNLFINDLMDHAKNKLFKFRPKKESSIKKGNPNLILDSFKKDSLINEEINSSFFDDPVEKEENKSIDDFLTNLENL